MCCGMKSALLWDIRRRDTSKRESDNKCADCYVKSLLSCLPDYGIQCCPEVIREPKDRLYVRQASYPKLRVCSFFFDSFSEFSSLPAAAQSARLLSWSQICRRFIVEHSRTVERHNGL